MLFLNDLKALAEARKLLGFFKDVDNDSYHAGPGVSSSILRAGTDTDAHMRAQMDQPPKITNPMELGSAIHAAILEPDVFFEKYIQLSKENSDFRLKASKEAKDEAIKANKIPLRFDDYETVKICVDRVWASQTANKLLSGHLKELAGYANEDIEIEIEENNEKKTEIIPLLRKYKTDCYAKKIGALVDIKSCDTASYYLFRKRYEDNGNHQQAAYHVDVHNDCVAKLFEHMTTEEMTASEFQYVDSFINIALETSAPYGVAIFGLGGDDLEIGRKEINPIKKRFAKCLKTGIWEAYPDTVQELNLSPWRYDQALGRN
jgi:hypothetical protein